MDCATVDAGRLGKILLVDDTLANLAVLSAALEPEGYEILVTSDGATALSLAAKARPDLILLDIMMPALDGLQTCRRLKQDESTSSIPVIFLTARGEMEILVEGFAVGAVDYVVKPFRGEELLRRVSTHVRLSRLSLELREKNRALEAQRSAARLQVKLLIKLEN